MTFFSGKNIMKNLAIFMLMVSFLFCGASSVKADPIFANSYSKPVNGTLNNTEWNTLPDDFLNRKGTAQMDASLTIGQSLSPKSLTVFGPITLNSGLGARYISAGNFGELTGYGNYFFTDISNVGIGTTSAAYKLNVGGDINFSGNLLQNGVAFTGSRWGLNGTSIFYNTGNVGIGTTNPDEKLHVAGTIKATSGLKVGTQFFSNSVYSQANGILISTDIAVSDNEMMELYIEGNSHSGWGAIGGKVTAYNYVIGGYINSPVYVTYGIAPSEVRIFYHDGVVKFWMAQTSSSQTYRFRLGTHNSSKKITSIQNVAMPTTGVTNEVIVTPKTVINNNVGIGTTSPNATLHVSGSYQQDLAYGVYGQYNMTFANADQRFATWNFYTNTAITPDFFGKFGFKFEGGTSDAYKQFQIHIANSSVPKFVVSGSGNVGIGTTVPTSKIHIVDLSSTNSYVSNLTALTNTGMATSQLVAVRGTITNSNTSETTIGTAGSFIATNSSTGTSVNNWAIGLSATARQSSANAMNYMFGVASALTVDASKGAVSSARGYDSGASIGVSSTVSDLRHFNASDTTGTGAVTHQYGLYIADLTKGTTNNYSIYTGTAKSYFGGSIGIGITNPYSKLHIGSANFLDNDHSLTFGASTGFSYYYGIGTAGSSGAEGIGIWGGTEAVSKTATNAHLFVRRNSGNVGVGTTTPSRLLHVAGSAQLDGISYGVTPGSNQTLGLTTVEYVNSLISGVSTSTVGYWSANGTNIYNANSGNVGVGTTTPSQKLDVNGISKAFQHVSYGTPLAHPTGIGTYVETYVLSGNTGRLFAYDGSSYKDLAIGDWNGGNPNIMLKAGGNVGFGVGSPVGNLHVLSAPGTSQLTILENPNGLQNRLSFVETGGSQFTIGLRGSTDTFVIGTSQDVSTNEKLVVTSLGNVGIGTTTPSRLLHVAGSAQLDAISYGVTPGSNQTLGLTTVEYVNSLISGVSTSTVGYWTANGNNISNSNSGNVGIGTSSLGSGNKLVVSGGDLSLTGAFEGSGASNNNFFEGKLGIANLSAGSSSLSVNGNATIGAAYVSVLAPTNGLLVEGNIGIGLTAPTQKLHVNGNAQIDGGMVLNGNLQMASHTLTVNKITANTIDPLYTIKGVQYSTFASAIVGGVKEEYVSRIYASDFKKVLNEYEYIINFSKLKEGSDLWVWHQVVDFNDENVEIFLTPRQQASMYAFIKGDNLIIRSSQLVDASMRLVGKRYDWRDWPTKSLDQNQAGGLVLE